MLVWELPNVRHSLLGFISPKLIDHLTGLVEAPDGGWGWVVVAGSFLANVRFVCALSALAHISNCHSYD